MATKQQVRTDKHLRMNGPSRHVIPARGAGMPFSFV
jgi:hypothetical protein